MSKAVDINMNVFLTVIIIVDSVCITIYSESF